MQSGKLNRRISILEQTATKDAVGQQLPTWTPIYTCWASMDVQGSQLLYSTAEFMSKTTHRISIRWASSVVISAKHRIRYVEPSTDVIHTFEIIAPLNDRAANRQMTLLCYELNGKE